jgi:hypothetical protein
LGWFVAWGVEEVLRGESVLDDGAFVDLLVKDLVDL